MKKFLLAFWLCLPLVASAQAKFVRTVNDAAELQALQPDDIHNVVFMRGYASASAADGARFYYDSTSAAATNTVSVFKPTAVSGNGRWIRQDPMFQAGSATVPSITFGLDADTGFANTGANTLDVLLGGTKRWTFTSAGIFQAAGAQTIQTATGDLTIATAGGNGNILLNANGTGGVGIGATPTTANSLKIGGTTASTSSITGSLINAGGLGNAGKIYAGDATATTSSSTGSVLSSGGYSSSNTTDATSASNGGTLTLAGGAAVAKKLYVGGIASVTDTTASTSGTTGALVVSGGAGFSKKINVVDSANPQLRLAQADTTIYTDIQSLSNGATLITNTAGQRVTSSVVNDTAVLSRPLRGGLAFDGVTASTRVTHTLGSGIGTGDFSVRVSFICPTSTSTVYGILNINSSNSDANAVGSFQIYFNGDGTLKVRIFGPGSTADSVFAYVSNFVTSFAGKAVDVVFTRSGTTDVLYANGVAQTLTEGSGGTNPTWAASVPGTYVILGSMNGNLFNSTIYSATLFNRALTAAEVVTLANQGVQEADKWGSMTDAMNLTTLNGGFETASGGVVAPWVTSQAATWVASASGSVTFERDTTVFNSGTASCKINISDNAFWQVYQNGLTGGRLGKWWRISFYAKADSACSPLILNFVGSQTIGTPSLTTSWTKYTYDVVNLSTTTLSGFRFQQTGANSGRTVWIDDVIVTPIGSILDADLTVGVGYQAPDRSSNNYHGVISTTGVSHVLAQRRGQVRYPFVFSGAGNVQLNAQQMIPLNAILQDVTVYSTGTPNIYIGSASGGNQYVAATGALTASTYKSCTIAQKNINAGGNLWMNSDIAATVNATISYMIADP